MGNLPVFTNNVEFKQVNGICPVYMNFTWNHSEHVQNGLLLTQSGQTIKLTENGKNKINKNKGINRYKTRVKTNCSICYPCQFICGNCCESKKCTCNDPVEIPTLNKLDDVWINLNDVNASCPNCISKLCLGCTICEFQCRHNLCNYNELLINYDFEIIDTRQQMK